MSNKSKPWEYWMNQERKKWLRKEWAHMLKKDYLVRSRTSLGHEKECSTETAAEPTFIFLKKPISRSYSWSPGQDFQSRLSTLSIILFMSSLKVFLFQFKELKILRESCLSLSEVMPKLCIACHSAWHSSVPVMLSGPKSECAVLWRVVKTCQSSLTYEVHRVAEGANNTPNCNQIQTQRKPITSSKE